MFANTRRVGQFYLLPLVFCLGLAGESQAAWFTVKNETKRVLVVQSAVPAGGHVKRCRPVRLLPGETCRQCAASSCITLEVYDARDSRRLLLAESLTFRKEAQAVSVVAGQDGDLVARASAK